MLLLLFGLQVMSNSLQPHRLQHTRPLCPSLSPEVCPSSCLLNRWYHPTILSSVTHFSSCPPSFPVPEPFPLSWLFLSCDQIIGTSASASVLPMSIQGWFHLRLTGLISLLLKGLSRVFSSTRVQRHQFFGTQPSLWSNSHICTRLLKRLDYLDLCWKVMFLLFNILSRFVIDGTGYHDLSFYLFFIF